jgi:hypothetical protein
MSTEPRRRGGIPPNEAVEAPETPTGGVTHQPGAAPEFAGDHDVDTPMHPDRVTIGPLAAEIGEMPDQVAQKGPSVTVAEGDGLSADEREARGIIDESRHTSSMGQR